MGDILFGPLSFFFLSFFLPCRAGSRCGRDSLDHHGSPADIPSVSAVLPLRLHTNGAQAHSLRHVGRSDLCFHWTHSSEGLTNMPILRLTQHSLAQLMWVIP